MNALFDIILLGAAVFAVWRLYSIFGSRTGFERSDKPSSMSKDKPSDAASSDAASSDAASSDAASSDAGLTDSLLPTDETARAAALRAVKPLLKAKKANDEVAASARAGLTEIEGTDKNFSTRDFFKGARVAYKMIIESFAAGDSEGLKKLLDPKVWERFQAEIEKRAAAGHFASVLVQNITAAHIVRADRLESGGTEVQITIEMESRQLAWTKDGEGRIIAGDPNTPREMKDVWTFARRLNSANPNWFLVATGKQ